MSEQNLNDRPQPTKEGAIPWERETERRRKIMEVEANISKLMLQDIDKDIQDKEKQNVESGAIDRPIWHAGFASKVTVLQEAIRQLYEECRQINENRYKELTSQIADLMTRVKAPDPDDTNKLDVIRDFRKMGADILIELQKNKIEE
jgi:excinuclease UvrABC helicase subunit UvrB